MPPATSQDQLVAKVKRLLLRHGGVNGLRGLARAVGVVDGDDAKWLSPAAFAAALRSQAVDLKDEEVAQLAKEFDSRGDGTIGVGEFLAALRCRFPAERKAWVNKAWRTLPKTRGAVALPDMHKVYTAAAHPDVLAGRQPREEVEAQLKISFNAETNPTGLVSKEDFELWCSGVSAECDSAEHFALLMSNCWRLSGPKRTTNSYGSMAATCHLDGQPKLPMEQTPQDKMLVIEAMRRKDQLFPIVRRLFDHLCSRPSGIRGVGLVYRAADKAGRGFLPMQQFASITKAQDLPLSDAETGLLLEAFDADGFGTVNYDEFLLHIRGDLPAPRKKALERAFARLQADNAGYVASSDMRARFQVFKNPTETKGLRSADQIAADFAAAFPGDAPVSYEEFEEYYATVSPLVKNDRHFGIMMENVWR